MRTVDSAVRLGSYAGGQVLGAVTRVVAARPAPKPLHPRGEVRRATLSRSGTADRATGAAWLDLPGEDEALVRLSRAIGLPGRVADFLGLAVRVPVEGGGHGDLLFASTGLGPVSRFMLVPGRSSPPRPVSTLLPYRSPAGPVVLSARFRDEGTLDLSWAVGAGRWHRFAVLRLHEDDAEPGLGDPDALISFDPVTHPLPGLATYEWVRLLREPAYATARITRAASRRPQTTR